MLVSHFMFPFKEDILNFWSSLQTVYIPKEWEEVNVVCISKAGKINHNTAKDYRPISLPVCI